MGRKQKAAVVKPPELPPEVPDEEIEVSDEDLQFVAKNRRYASFVSRLDTKSITKHVTRVAGAKEDELEALYEKQLKKRSLQKEDEKGLLVDPVDALPVKTLDGKLHYRTASKPSPKLEGGDIGDQTNSEVDDGSDMGVVKLTKVEKRQKLKKTKKEAKMQAKELAKSQEEGLKPQTEVLAEVKEDLTAEEAVEDKKRTIAELGTSLLSDPEANVKSLKTLLELCMDEDGVISRLGLLSSLAVFRDIIPGYRIRLPTEKELQMNVSKTVKKMRYFESTLLSAYKAYLLRLISLEQDHQYHQVAIRCLCTLLDAHPHFNYRENLLAAVVKNISSSNDATRILCCRTIKSLFTNEGKHGGEATIEAVRLIAEQVKVFDCELHPDSIEVFLSLSFNEDLGRSEKKDDDKGKYKRNKRRKKGEEKQSLVSDKKRSKKELLYKTREEVDADYKAATFTRDIRERKRMQSDLLSSVFATYFRILKHAVPPPTQRTQVSSNSFSGIPREHPLLESCLKGVGKLAHLIDMDFMADLMKVLKILASGKSNCSDGSDDGYLTVSERLQCCIVAFRVMRNNLDALKVDLQDFFVQLYSLVLEYRPDRDQGDILAEALKIMLCDDRQHDMQRAGAFIKRLATSALFYGCRESMAALVTVKQLLQKNAKCRNMLENDPGGGSASGSIVKYQPYSSDPHVSGALASVLWDLGLLSSHYHPAVSTMSSGILSMSTVAHNQVYMSTLSPQQAFTDFSLDNETFQLKTDAKRTVRKRKRGAGSDLPLGGVDRTALPDEDCLRKKLSIHFTVLHDIEENERLRRELNRTSASLSLHDEYLNQIKGRGKKENKRKV